MIKKSVYLFVLTAGMAVMSWGQVQSNKRYHMIDISKDTITLDKHSIVPHSLLICDSSFTCLDTTWYRVNYLTSKLYWIQKPKVQVYARYRVFPFAMHSYTFHKHLSSTNKKSIQKTKAPSFIYHPYKRDGTVDLSHIDYNGSFSRGVIFGNSQDLILNSSFNLQVSGLLAKDLKIEAAITDSRIPIQPDGNTRELREFDKIFIRLNYKTHQLQFGDINLSPTPINSFLKFDRKIQGVAYKGAQDIGRDAHIWASSGMGLSRAKFTRNTLSVVEGNQGPYRLTGALNEIFITVIAGSEKVYVDGRLMNRGQDADYIIDYNLGEIVFTSKQLVKQEMRVVVEFQYVVQNYLRTLAFSHIQFKYKKWTFWTDVFAEQDGKNNRLGQRLTDSEKEFLVSVGDKVNNVLLPRIQTVDFDPNRILYKRIDTTVLGILYDSVFVFSTQPNEAIYQLGFSFVGANNGNYQIASTGANGRVYQWIAPVNGVPQGAYEPVRKVVAPVLQHIYSAGGRYQIGQTGRIDASISVSNFDANRFSSNDRQDDIGIASRVKYNQTHFLKSKDSSKHSLQTILSYLYQDANFHPIQRFQPIEFTRNWNVSPDFSSAQHLAKIQVSYRQKKYWHIAYQLRSLIRIHTYKGIENYIVVERNKQLNQFRADIRYLWTRDSLQKTTQFIRPNIYLSKSFKQTDGLRIGVHVNYEINRVESRLDVLDSSSFLWQKYTTFIRSPQSNKNVFNIEFVLRTAHAVKDGHFMSPHTFSQAVRLYGHLNKHVLHRFSYRLNYRHFASTLKDNRSLEHNYLGRLSYRFKTRKGGVRIQSFYEVNTGREQRIQYTYIRANEGLGTYAWQDLNNNGILELNEVYVSAFPSDNIYVRIANENIEFVPVNRVKFNALIWLDARRRWQKSRGFNDFLSRFSTKWSIQQDKQSFLGSSIRASFNPFARLADDNIVTYTSQIRGVLYFNRTLSLYNIEAGWKHISNQILLTNGTDRTDIREQYAKIRWNIWRALTWQTQYTNGRRIHTSSFFPNNRYDILSNEVKTELTYVLRKKHRFSIEYIYWFKTNKHPETRGIYAVNNQINIDTKINIKSKSIIQAKASISFIGFAQGQVPNRQIELALLNVYRKGNNYTWNIDYTQKISKSLELHMRYEGRKIGGASTIVHTGTAQIRAIF